MTCVFGKKNSIYQLQGKALLFYMAISLYLGEASSKGGPTIREITIYPLRIEVMDREYDYAKPYVPSLGHEK